MLALFTISDAHVYAYTTILIAGSSYAYYDSISYLVWPLISFLFVLPATNLLVNFGYVAANGPVLAFKQIAPVASGIGWALTWHVGERLYRQTLIASQTLLYIIFSFRTRLDWALDCKHSYNNGLCRDFSDLNVSDYHTQDRHEPDNNWPAQQFNKYCVRGLDKYESDKQTWQPNGWYYGYSDHDSIFPSIALFCANIIVWMLIFVITRKDERHASTIVSRACLFVPWLIYVFLLVYHTFVEFSFAEFSETTDQPIKRKVIEGFPYVFFSDVYGFFSSTLAFIDYSVAFSGIIIYASSRTRPTGRPLNVPLLCIFQMFIPMALYGLQHGCKGHLRSQQPAYDTYSGSDATVIFDTMAVCFANTSMGPVWSILYFAATFLYNAIGPMAIFVMFVQNSLIEQFPSLEGMKPHVSAAICAMFAVSATTLFTPVGTAFSTLFEYTTQASVTQVVAFAAIMFLCGWHKLERSMNSLVGNASGSLVEFIIGHSSPVFSILLFVSVPMFLALKYVSEFDLLLESVDVSKHIEYAVQGLTPFSFVNTAFGYAIVFMPFAIILNLAMYNIYYTIRVEKMPLSSAFKETVHFGSPNSLGQTIDDSPLVTSLFKRCFFQDRTLVLILGIIEALVAVMLMCLFGRYTFFHSAQEDINPYRIFVIFVLLTLNLMQLIELKWLHSYWDSPYRINFHIAVSTLETAFLNAYLLMAAFNHSNVTDDNALFVMLLHTFFRTLLLSMAITIRSKLVQNRPSRTRDVTEIYDINNGLDDHGDDRDDDSPIVYNLS